MANPWKRYAAHLLFYYRVKNKQGKKIGRRHTSQERIFVLNARSDREVLKKAKERGKAAQMHYLNSEANPVDYLFLGIRRLINLDICEADEVWYYSTKILDPEKRRSVFIPSDKELLANT